MKTVNRTIKKYLTVLFLTAFASTALAQDTVFSISEITLRTGKSGILTISLDNENPIIMTEFYLQLPNGIEIKLDDNGYLDTELNTERCDRTHSLNVVKSEDGLYHFLCYSNRNTPFIGTAGELIRIGLNCGENIEAGTYNGAVKNILLSDDNKNPIELPDMSFSLIVIDYTPGDINDDDYIDGVDIVEAVNLIMNNGYVQAADLYPVSAPDGLINGMDLVEEVDLVLSQPTGQNMPSTMIFEEGLNISSTVDGMLRLGVTSPEEYVLAQMNIELQEGMSLEEITTDGKHTVAWRQTGYNQYMVVCYSSQNFAFDNNYGLLFFRCAGQGEINISDMMLVDVDKNEHCFGGKNQSIATDITSKIVTDENGVVYDLQGRKVVSFSTPISQWPKGVFLVNNKKVVVK